MLDRIALTWRTLRHLRPEQVAARVAIRLRRKVGGPLHEHERRRSSVALREIPAPVRHRPRSPDPLLAGKLVFHAREWSLESPPWHEEALPRLWRYQLHDFEWAQDLLDRWRGTDDPRTAALFERLAIDWIERNPPRAGDGWHPYTVSMRLCAWARALAGFGDSLEAAAAERIGDSLRTQYAWTLGLLERDVLGNHLLENVRALAVAGLLVSGDLGERGRRRARAILAEQLPRQVLPDGGHYERSPMYHLIVLGAARETVDALEAAGLAVGEETHATLARMARFGRAMLDARGEPLSLGDSVPGEGPVPREALEAPRDDSRIVLFPDSGYVAMRSADARDRLVFDVGDTCPDELPAHAHADALSFVIERDGRPLVVDPGVGEYAPGPWRDYARATRAHSTIEIDGRDQSEVWGSFRVGRRARALPLRREESGGAAWIEGGHTGYRAHPARAIHRRRVVSRADGGWLVKDRVRSRRPCAVRSFVHLAPDLTPVLEPGGALVRRGTETVARLRWSGFDEATEARGETRPAQGWVFPGFGRREPASVIALSGHGAGDSTFRLEIDP